MTPTAIPGGHHANTDRAAPRSRQALPRHAPRSPASTSTSTRASSDCSARTEPARRRCCACWPPCSARTRARCGSSAATQPLGATAHRDPAPARLPAAGARLPARLLGLRLPRLHGRPQGVGRPGATAGRGTPGARAGRSRRPRRPSGSGRCPGASDVGSGWPRRCSARRSCSCSTSRPTGSTPSSGYRCGTCSPRSVGPRRSSSPRTRPRTSPRCASASSCSTEGRAASTAPSATWSRPPTAGSGSTDEPDPRRSDVVAYRHRRAIATSATTAPAGAEVADPSLEDAYLLLRAERPGSEVAA